MTTVRIVRNICTVIGLAAAAYVGLICGIGSVTLSQWGASYNSATAPTFWIATAVAVALLGSAVGGHVLLYLLRRTRRRLLLIGTKMPVEPAQSEFHLFLWLPRPPSPARIRNAQSRVRSVFSSDGLRLHADLTVPVAHGLSLRF